MSMQYVECKGSGAAGNAGINAKRAICGHCRKMVDVAPSTGRLRKHTRRMTGAQLRRGR